jgi:hypothetical protein
MLVLIRPHPRRWHSSKYGRGGAVLKYISSRRFFFFEKYIYSVSLVFFFHERRRLKPQWPTDLSLA